ncbi:MAG TPA: hypothetical protein VF171_01070, partial [Trueperaceae bacterium]
AARDLFLRVDGLADWGAPVPTEPRSLNCVRYGPPRMAHPVVWCPHHQDYGYGGRYYPHNWPRAAGPAIMAFFRSLP